MDILDLEDAYDGACLDSDMAWFEFTAARSALDAISSETPADSIRMADAKALADKWYELYGQAESARLFYARLLGEKK